MTTTTPQTALPATYQEAHRPQCHYTPAATWLNDPNGLVFHNGVYHLFFQQNPLASTFDGVMHWGHATSHDLMHWEHQPTALSPDDLGVIYSGSAVVDTNNTSGLGEANNPALVAVFTHHNNALAATTNTYETQSLAYSGDNGQTWTKYEGNPVLKNPGIRDFRDPKVCWYAPSNKWVMALAVSDHIEFYSSPNLKEWTKESEFGQGRGAHGGVWECPDLIELTDGESNRWVLLVSLNTGAPNVGSATQYFIGDFDGSNFTSTHDDTRWIDYGPDNYAGVTWSNVESRCLLLGWMSNWAYAHNVPTAPWRGAMTIPRQLRLRTVGDSTYIASQPVDELQNLLGTEIVRENIPVSGDYDLSEIRGGTTGPFLLTLRLEQRSLAVVLANASGTQVLIGYDELADSYFVDRTGSGIGFAKSVPGKATAPRIATHDAPSLTLLVDVSSVEVFADGGLVCLTSIFFPGKPLDRLMLRAENSTVVESLRYAPVQSIWRQGQQ